MCRINVARVAQLLTLLPLLVATGAGAARASDLPPATPQTTIDATGCTTTRMAPVPAFWRDGSPAMTDHSPSGALLATPVRIVMLFTIKMCPHAQAPLAQASLTRLLGDTLGLGRHIPAAYSEARSQRHAAIIGTYRETRITGCAYNQGARAEWDITGSNVTNARFWFATRTGQWGYGDTNTQTSPPQGGIDSFWVDPAPDRAQQKVELWTQTTGYIFDYTYCY